MNVTECYDGLADYYHLIFERWEASINRQAALLAPILEHACGPAGRVQVLDCASGIGTQSLGLARRGFQVVGCDLSPRSVERAQREARLRHLDIQFSVANMLDLTCFGDSRFDAVICIDNALPHLRNGEELDLAVAQMRHCLRSGGWLMASIRDYDRLLEERPSIHPPTFYGHQKDRRIVFQVWDWHDDRRYVFHLYITHRIANQWHTIHASADYRAIRRDELAGALGRARFKQINWFMPAETGFYQPIVLAKAD